MTGRRGFLGAAAAFAFAGGCRTAREAGGARRAEALRELRAGIGLGHFDCAVACGAGDECVAAARDGMRVGADSLFEVASVSKVFTASICARLHAQGAVDIRRPVFGCASAYDLATHTSGYTDAWMGRAGVFGRKWPFGGDAEYEAAVRRIVPSYAKGEKCVYACTNMILLGFFLERELGMDLAAAARKFVWGPLGMGSTTWKNVPPDDPRLVRIYTKGPRPPGTKGDENARNFTRPIGNAGVFTCLGDLRLFVSDILSRRAFEREYYDLICAPAVEAGGRRRSFGWDMSPGTVPPGWSGRAMCHSGYTGQYVAVDPGEGRAAVVLTNLKTDDPQARRASFEARRRIAAILG